MKTEEYCHHHGKVTNPRCDLYELFGSQIVEDGIFAGVRIVLKYKDCLDSQNEISNFQELIGHHVICYSGPVHLGTDPRSFLSFLEGSI